MQGISRLAALRPEDRARVLARLRDGSSHTRAAPGRPRLAPSGSRGEPAVASFLQEQLWFLDQLVGTAPVYQPAYNVPFSFRLRGPLDVDALLDAISDVVGRHDVLRSRLVLAGGRLLQAPGPAPRVTVLEVADPADERRRVDELARTRFDLAAGPLLRVELLRRGPAEHRLVWVAHHAVIDGWSVGLLVDQLRAAYRGPAAAPPTLQYADFARWQRERLAGAELDALLAYWRDRLAGARFDTVPIDRPRPPVQTFRGGLERFTVPAPLASAVRALATRHRVTPFAALLAAFQVVVAGRAGTPDAVVGVPVAGRATPELQNLVGPVSNTVPVRVDLSDDPPFRTVLARVSDALLDAAGHHEVPLGRLVGSMGADGAIRKDISRNPLFGVVFNMDTLPVGAAGGELVPGVSLAASGHPNGTVRMDLELTVEQASGGALDARMEYNVDLYSPGTVRRLVERFRGLLGAVTADPDKRVSALGGRSPTTRPLVSASAGRISDWLDSERGARLCFSSTGGRR